MFFEVDAGPGIVLNCTFEVTPDGIKSEIKLTVCFFFFKYKFYSNICVLKAM